MFLSGYQFMKQNLCTIWFVALFVFAANLSLCAQKNAENQISDSLTAIANSYTRVGKVNVISIQPNQVLHTITITVNEKLGYMPFRQDNVKRIYKAINKIVAHNYNGYTLICKVDNKTVFGSSAFTTFSYQ